MESTPFTPRHHNIHIIHNFWSIHYSHFSEKETEAQKGYSACPRYSQLILAPGFELTPVKAGRRDISYSIFIS